MNFELKNITLEDKALFDSFFKDSAYINSEYTFTNMFMWRKSYKIRYALINDMLCIFSRHANSPETANFPLGIGDIKKAINSIVEYFDEIGQRPLIRIYDKKDMDILEDIFPNTFIFTEDRNSYDYVYNIDDLIQLSGNKYHSKRNHIYKFLSNYSYQYHHMTKESLFDCYNLFEKWCDSKEGLIDGINEQREAVSELFANMDSLDLKGGFITVDDKPVAFSIGEVLNKEQSVVVIHLEHADTEFQGSFPLINKLFLENEWKDFALVNREEDMGLSGLRHAKKSYHPCLMVKKYIASIK